MNKVYVFGRGKYCLKKIELLKDRFAIQGYLDNGVPVDAKSITEDGIQIHNPDFLRCTEGASVLVMVSMKYLKEAVEQLLSLGVVENDIYIGMNYEPACDSVERFMVEHKTFLSVIEGKLYITKGEDKYEVRDSDSVLKALRIIDDQSDQVSAAINGLPLEPHSRRFGAELGGKPIDRHYIEGFIKENRECVTGSVLEVASDLYTKRYGHEVRESLVSHVYGEGDNVIKMNLATGEGVEECMADCFICTQTLQMIYDLKAAMKNIYKLLKPNGTALITMHANSQISMGDDKLWGEHWRFTRRSAHRLAIDAGFSEDDVLVESYGNVKVVTAFLYGLCMEQINMSDFDFNDEQYPLIISVRAKKP